MSSFWMYLMHLPLLIAVALPMLRAEWPIPVKPAITLTMTTALLLSYDLLVRRSWIGRWLNGRRRDSVLLGPPRKERPSQRAEPR